MPPTVCESVLESAAVSRLHDLGYTVLAERASFTNVMLSRRPYDALACRNPHLPTERTRRIAEPALLYADWAV